MSARAAALLIAGLAALLYVGVAGPLQGQAAAYADAFGRARVERQDLARHLAELQRRSEARSRAIAAVKAAAGDPAVTTRSVRQSVARAADASRASDVNLTIRPSDAGVDVTVAARGSAGDMLDLSGQLARPESGVVLDRVSFTRADGRVGLHVTGLGIAEIR